MRMATQRPALRYNLTDVYLACEQKERGRAAALLHIVEEQLSLKLPRELSMRRHSRKT